MSIDTATDNATEPTVPPPAPKRRGQPRGQRRLHRGYPTLLVWRLALNLNQRDAARILGVNQTRYSRLERGVTTTKGAEAKRIIQRTGVPLKVLAGVA
jgi:hypothetical protein